MAKADAQPEMRPNRLSVWSGRHPVMAIVVVAALAVIINCYPVLFCGKSFTSPPGRFPVLHDGGPTFAGLKSLAGYDHGSDTAAPLLWSVPAGFIESRAIMEHNELPLWNRYGHAGDTLIGQAVSMLGDPLQLIVILGRSSSIAWDIKYLVAKFIFCMGFGLLVLRMIGSRQLSLLFAALAAYCGTYFYINNHPAFFLFSYGPWILLSAIEFLDLQSGRYVPWGLVWLVANIGCFNGGHTEPAVTLIGGLNLAGFAFALARSRGAVDVGKVVIRLGIGTFLFLGLTAPVWLSFLVTMAGAYSNHMAVQVNQLPVASVLGSFDDVFFRALVHRGDGAGFTPGTSLLIAVGSLFAVLRWRQLRGDRFFWINSAAIILWMGCIFKLIPASLFEAVPLLNRVGHIYTDFSYLLTINLTIQCAYGFKCLMHEKDVARTATTLIFVALILASLTVVYCVGVEHGDIPWNYFLCAAMAALTAPLLFVYLKNQSGKAPALLWFGAAILAFIPNFRFGLYHTGNDRMLLLPGSRIVLNERSAAIESIKSASTEPFRTVGLQRNLFGDYAAVYGLEDIRSCEPLSNNDFMKLLQTFPGISVSTVWITRVFNPVAARPLLNLLNVKYLLSSPLVTNTPGDGAFPVVANSDFVVLENAEAWPRAFFTRNVISIPSHEQFVSHLATNGTQPFVAITPDEIAKEPDVSRLLSAPEKNVAPADHYKLGVNSTAFDVHATSAGMVCLTEGQAKDFTATANGSPKKVLTVNRAFKGIYLQSPGDYHVEFIFRPRHWREACMLFWTAAGLVVILSGAYFASVKLKQNRPQRDLQSYD
jgi:hypothetical protein